MRLSQVARKLGVTQTTIREILEEHNFEAPARGNSKLDEEQLTFLYKHYNITVFTDPEEVKELEEEKVENEVEEVEEKSIAESPTPPSDEKKEQPADIVETGVKTEKPDEESSAEEDIEVIRAKKVKLEGIKVLGKIDLPEPKPKAEKEEKTDAKRDKRRPGQRNQRNKERNKRRSLSFEEKQVLETKKQLKEKEKREKELKAKKQAYFESRIKPKQKAVEISTKKKRKKKASDKSQTEKRTKLTSKNPFKRFWQWLNDPYA